MLLLRGCRVGLVGPDRDEAFRKKEKKGIDQGLVLADEDVEREVMIVVGVVCSREPVQSLGGASEERGDAYVVVDGTHRFGPEFHRGMGSMGRGNENQILLWSF